MRLLLVFATDAVIAAHGGDEASLLVTLDQISELGAIDALVIAQRASAKLIAALTGASVRPELATLLQDTR